MLKSVSDATGKLLGCVKSGIETAVEAGKNSLKQHGGASDIIIVRDQDGVLRSTEWHVHFDGDIQASEHRTQVRLWIAGRDSELTLALGKDNRCFFKHEGFVTQRGSEGQDQQQLLVPTEQQLQQLQLVSGRNEARFQVRELAAGTEVWVVKGELGCGVFVWNANDSVVVVDHEGALVRRDPWAKGAETIGKARDAVAVEARVRDERGEKVVHRAPIAESTLVREGAGALLSGVSQAGYRLCVITRQPISKVERVRDSFAQASAAEVKKWGPLAALPDAPILCAPDHTMAVITNLIASKALSVAGKMGKTAQSFPASTLSQLASLFSSKGGASVGGLAGGICYYPDDGGLAYVEGGVPPKGLLIVDKSGGVRMYAGAATGGSSDEGAAKWANYGEVPAADIFPKNSLL